MLTLEHLVKDNEDKLEIHYKKALWKT